MGFACTLPDKSGKPCGLVIDAATGLRELDVMARHIRTAHGDVYVIGGLLQTRVIMERGDVPPFYAVPEGRADA